LYGAIVASYGLHASLIADSDTPEYRKLGAKRFGMAAEELLKEAHPYRAKVVLRKRVTDTNGTETVVGERVERETHGYVLATLISNLEQNFCISPKSEPFDGKLRVVHFGAEPKEKVMAIMGAAYRGGRHVEEFADVLGYEEVVGLRIVFGEKEEKWRRVCVDGLIVVVEEGGWVDVEVVPSVDEVVDVLAP
jgi:diacylglycerol kinase family enzyme